MTSEFSVHSSWLIGGIYRGLPGGHPKKNLREGGRDASLWVVYSEEAPPSREGYPEVAPPSPTRRCYLWSLGDDLGEHISLQRSDMDLLHQVNPTAEFR
ncbi:hypothetical protein Taro_004958 [Colocasia esculenta]|uniref:Uncharacterized protein n=1 Tax=Colocasia esculenta TaxID=4460 RepID=A0A843TNQ9_COLES|nr:hypothetical protein [Colocasia esculenta]